MIRVSAALTALLLSALPLPGVMTQAEAQDTLQDFFAGDPIGTCRAEAEDPAHCIGKVMSECEGSPLVKTEDDAGTCVQLEHDYWDAELNATYGALMTAFEALDAEYGDASGVTANPLADRLRRMQRDWIPYRDSRCELERNAPTLGGAIMVTRCLMQVTAEQTLFLASKLPR